MITFGYRVLLLSALHLVLTTALYAAESKPPEGNCEEGASREKKSASLQPDSIKKTDTTITGTPPCETQSRTFKLCAVAEIHQRELQKYCKDQKPLRRDPYYILDYYE